MIKTKYGEISENLLKNYLDRLVNKIFKILPLKESQYDTLDVYIHSLLCELHGSRMLISELGNDTNFLAIISTLEYLLKTEESDKIFKREIFKCISLVRQIQSK